MFCSFFTVLQGQMLSFLMELYDDEETQGFTLIGLLSAYLSLNSLRHGYLMPVLGCTL